MLGAVDFNDSVNQFNMYNFFDISYKRLDMYGCYMLTGDRMSILQEEIVQLLKATGKTSGFCITTT